MHHFLSAIVSVLLHHPYNYPIWQVHNYPRIEVQSLVGGRYLAHHDSDPCDEQCSLNGQYILTCLPPFAQDCSSPAHILASLLSAHNSLPLFSWNHSLRDFTLILVSVTLCITHHHSLHSPFHSAIQHIHLIHTPRTTTICKPPHYPSLQIASALKYILFFILSYTFFPLLAEQPAILCGKLYL